MSARFIIAGTDTDVGKTVFSAMLMLGIGASYWKPVQCGVADGIDTRIVQNLTGLPDERFFPEAYILTEPLSPHRAAEIDGVVLDMQRLTPPISEAPLLIEGAGGLLVPMTRDLLQIGLFRRWNESAPAPVILCARTGLGTINHTLLSLEALRERRIPVHGIAFIGDDNLDTIKTIGDFSGAKILGRMPRLTDIDARRLTRAFEENFRREDFGPESSG